MKKEFIVERQGRSFVLYAGLLDAAHADGLSEVSTEIVQIPSDANGQTAIVQARVKTAKGMFSGIGDANPSNVSRMMVPHLLRMAETRSKARALRDAVNIGVLALEETGDEDDAADDAERRRLAWKRTEVVIDELNSRHGPATVDRAAFGAWFQATYGVPYNDQAPVSAQTAAQEELEKRRRKLKRPAFQYPRHATGRTQEPQPAPRHRD